MLVFVFLMSGCGGGGSCEDMAATRDAVPQWDPESIQPLYGSDNPFTQPIGDNPELHPQSDTLATSLVEEFEQSMVLSVEQWTVPVFIADADTPRMDVEFGARWAPYSVLHDVPVPTWAAPDPSSDGSIAILDLEAGLEYDFWEFCSDGESAWAGWGNVTSLDGNGIFSKGLSARGSGFALLNGLIWPHELEAGHIDHALMFTYNLTRQGGPVAPATESDGTGGGDNNLPEGARVQLDPDLDVASLGLPAWQETIAVAMQEYGMFLGDDGGGIELEAIHPYSFTEGAGAYDGLIDLEDGYGIFSGDFPIDRFRVLDYGAQNPDFGETSDVEYPERFE